MGIEDNFVAVFPSNAQPEIFPDNTASSFSTRFETSKQLDGEWEVTVKDLSFVNTVQTIKNEKISVSQKEKVFKKPSIAIDLLEDEKKIVSYDMRQHSREWILAMSTTNNKVTQRELQVVTILTIFNRLMGNVFWWTWNKNVYLRFTQKIVKNPYGVFVSDHLKDILNLHTNLILPMEHFWNLKRDNVGMFPMNEASLQVGGDMTKEAFTWNKDKRFDFTLLPTHRMKKVKVVIPSENRIERFIDKFNQEMKKYGLVAACSYREVVDKDSDNKKKVADKDADKKKPDKKKKVADKVLIEYTNHFDTSDIAFISLHNKTFNVNDKYMTYFYAPKVFTYPLKLKKEGSIPKCEILIWKKEVELNYHEDIKWKCDIELPTKYYKNEQQLLAVLNDHSKVKDMKLDYLFSFNMETDRFHLDVKNGFILKISKKLQSILGFNQNKFEEGSYTAIHSAQINQSIYHFYLYSNIIAPIHVGGTRVQLLCYVPFPNVDYGDVVYKEFLTPIYVPVCVNQLQQVDIAVFDDAGERINFEQGRTVVKLHFRKRNYV